MSEAKPETPEILNQIAGCTLCAERFARTQTRHRPNPIFQYAPGARILIASQAPGARAHASSTPFLDPSGARLRNWLGLDKRAFYDPALIAILPMGFCFPGYDAKGADLPPPRICAQSWRERLFEEVGRFDLTLLIGGYAQKYHLGTGQGVTETVAGWRDHAPRTFPLPHPSWRNTAWLKKNPWFEAELLPILQKRVKEVLA